MKTIKLLINIFMVLGVFHLSAQNPPANDDICNAEELFMFDPPTGGSTVDATDELGEINPGCFTGANLETVWYKFTAPNNGYDVRITTDFQDTLIDTQIAVYEAPGDCANLFTLNQEIACESADNGDVTSFSTTLEADNLTIGDTYYIQVDKEGTTPNGLFEIAVESIPPNDDLCDSETIFVSQGNPDGNDYTLLGASEEANEPAASCFDDGINGSVWFDFVAPENGEVTISTDLSGGSLSDSEIAVYEAPGDCADLSTLGPEVGCNQDISTANFLSSVNLTNLNAGDTYYLQVDRWGTADDGRFGVEITTPAPTNDDICDAIDLTFGGSTTPDQYSNLGASSETDEPVPGCFFGGVDNSVWFKFTAPANADGQDLKVTTDFAGGTLTDTEVAVYGVLTDCTDPTTFNPPIACDQDGGNNVNFNSVVNIPNGSVVGGFTYYIQVDNAGASGPGSFGIEVDYKSPSNDSICDPIALTVGAEADNDDYDIFGATAEANEPVPNCFDGGINGSVWFSFVAPSNADNQDVRVTTDIEGSTLDDTEIAVYEAPTDCTDLTTLGNELGCDQDSGSYAFTSTIDFSNLTPGDVYFIQVDRWGSADDGSFGIEVDYTPPANDNLCDAFDLAVNGSTTPDQYDTFGATNEPNEPVAGCFNDGINSSVWFSFTAPSNGEATVTTDFSGGSLSDTEVAVYEAPTNCADMVTLGAEQGCNQDVDINNGQFLSEVNLTGLTPNATYYIQVDRFSVGYPNGTFGIEVQSTLSTDNFNKTDFTYYPNPAKNTLNVDIDQVVSQYSIYNMAGKKVLVGSPESIDPKINISSLQTGTYLVKISVEGKSASFRIIKE